MTLTEKLNSLSYPKLSPFSPDSATTVAEFWEKFVSPMLPKTQEEINVYIEWYKLLLRYCNDTDPVYVIRAFADRKGKSDKALRRGFYTKTQKGYSFFYTDNFFAAYFAKMALDGFVPDYNEFKELMLSRNFPARFGPFCQCEKEKAAYSIDGKKGKDPYIQSNGYKIAHIVDSGKDYSIRGNKYNLGDICELLGWFPRGDYDDWKKETDAHGEYYVRHLTVSDDIAKDALKAHFLRLACPLNYVLTPKPSCHKALVKDIAEAPAFQQYAMEQFKKLFGTVYEEYLNHLMLCPTAPIKNPGDTVIDIEYDINFALSKKKGTPPSVSSAPKIKAPKAPTKIGTGIGQYAKDVFTDLLLSKKLSSAQTDLLRSKAYCSEAFGISFPVLAKVDKDVYDRLRYYKNQVEGYVICSQWYERSREKIDSWLKTI